MRQGGVLRATLVFAVLLVALAMVIHRQSRALDLMRELDRTRNEMALVEVDRAELARRAQRLQSRAHVVAAAGERLGLAIPAPAQIVILPFENEMPGATERPGRVFAWLPGAGLAP